MQNEKEDLSLAIKKLEDGISELNKEHIGIKSKDKVYFCEIELDKFTDDIITYESSYLSDINGLIYDPVSEYPSSIRDLSFSIKDHSKLNQLHDQILSTNLSILKEVFVFDFYDDAKNKVLKIGLLAPMSGEYKDLGNSLLYSLQLALNEINDKNVLIIPADSGSDDKRKLNEAIKQIRSQGVKIIFGPINNEDFGEVKKYSDLIFISPSNIIPEFQDNIISIGISLSLIHI